MTDKYVEFGTGGALQEKEATDVSTGAVDVGKIVALDSLGRISGTMLPPPPPVQTGNKFSANTTEDLAPGDLVALSGPGQISKALGDDPANIAVGYVKSSYTTNDLAEVFIDGVIEGLSNLAIGSRYYLHPSAFGGFTNVAPNGSGEVAQFVGLAISGARLLFKPDEGILQA